MNIRLKDNLAAIWLTAALLSIILPVFVPSFAEAHGIYANVIEMSMTTLFVISLPTSLFAFGLLYLEMIVGLDPNGIGVMYWNLWMFFALGALQWFVIVPRLLRGTPRIQTLGLPQSVDDILLTEAKSGTAGFLDHRYRTPVERVIADETHK